MSEHKATITWKRTSPDFLKGKYSREHSWTFDGGLTIPASPSPSVVPVPYSNPAHVDPEEAYVASISSCHMLTFLFIASQQGFQVDSYEDEAIGAMTKNEKGVPWVSSVTLNPESLIENWERCCGLGFWIWARRSRRSIPGAGCDACDNEGQSQKTCRPEGFRVNGRLASLLLSRRPTRGILLRRASPYSHRHKNSTTHSFQSGSEIVYSGEKLPTPDDEERLHHLAHEQCFIANSVKTEISVTGTNRR